ncbi:alginate export family protein [Neptuniibacter sp. QD72_48]|uniref:alginate export family protein n=1 Tax=unclassified Neptuniibacter TaxID=2630693 RepID=UPI0039F7346B
MNQLPSKLLLATAIAAISTPSAYAAESIAEAFQNGETSVSFRLRYEDVEDDSAAEDANALTLKSRLTFKTDEFKSVSALVEVDDVTELDDVEYNDGVNGMGTKTKIVDPEGTEVNQAYLAFTGLSDTTVKVGRQRILLDNQRFVGGVGFRQNEQTYDSLSVKNSSLADTEVFYAYINDVHGITGSDSKHKTHLFNVKYKGLPFGVLTGYYYNFEEDKVGGYDLDTYGVRFSGSQDAGDTKLLYTAEYATQDNGSTDPDYYLLEGGVAFSGVTTKLGYEVLGSDGGVGFNTPLATKHKFQGWVDQFLATPADGIEDIYISVGTKLAGVKLLAVYHDYEVEETGADLGSEWGFVAAKKFGKNYGLSLKYADYDAGDTGADKSKLWLTATANF